ncbi:peroxiredoxin [Haloactinospora alba]|uniref:Alkyl hydroperoxide reductase E n=1 Tax=Haloactinospora alba TaxID=405555 RepID=A0A543NI42_9ACTN|nr:peroxiredoxin [Haloactinospora alba]TQN31420.1 peroxiredoxin [Haloactinospora alba]
MPLESGDAAPEFALADQHGQIVRLSDFSGRRAVLLVFYPLAFSSVCGSELEVLRDNLAEFESAGVQLLSVSVDSMFAHRVWDDREGFGFPLLSDFWPHGGVARSYGVFDETKGVALRATLLVDRSGTVRWKAVNPVSEGRVLADYRAALTGLR